MNRVILLGRLTKDVELKQTPNGVSVVNFTIAVNRRFDKEQADFINCIAWRNTAEFVAKYFSKGSSIAVVGSIQTGSYEKEGQKVYTTDVNVEEVYFAGSKASNESGASEGAGNAQQDFSGFTHMTPIDDDLPF
jgi:single-strand DNA-binding protein